MASSARINMEFGDLPPSYRSASENHRTRSPNMRINCLSDDLQTQQAPKMSVRKIAIDVLFVIILAAVFCIFEFVISPYRRGYFCDDDSVRYNYKTNTISTAVIFGVGAAIPIVIMGITDCIRYYKGILETTKDLWISLYKDLFVFAFGALCGQLVTDIAKCSVGRLRPHFLDVCNSTYTCIFPEEHDYITNYVCQGPEDLLREARMSFPSGHATFAAFTMVFASLFLQFRFHWNGSDFVRPLIQLALVSFAFYVGLSRISDNMHHWSDVLTGFLIGIISATFSALVVSDLRETEFVRSKQNILSAA